MCYAISICNSSPSTCLSSVSVSAMRIFFLKSNLYLVSGCQNEFVFLSSEYLIAQNTKIYNKIKKLHKQKKASSGTNFKYSQRQTIVNYKSTVIRGISYKVVIDHRCFIIQLIFEVVDIECHHN